MSEKKLFKCETCGYILEHDTMVVLPACPECGDVDNWVAFEPIHTDGAKVAEHQQNEVKSATQSAVGFAQSMPRDITEGDAVSMAMDALRDVPMEKAMPKTEPTFPFARPEETGFEHIVPGDITESAVNNTGLGGIGGPAPKDDQPASQAFARPEETSFEQTMPRDITEGDAGSMAVARMQWPDEAPEEKLKYDEYAFKMPHDTGFEQVVPTDYTEGDTSRTNIRSIIGPNITEADRKPSRAFEMPQETGFEQVIPTDITEGDSSRANIGSIIGPSDKEVNTSHKSTQPFARPEETGFEQFIPMDITEGDTTGHSIASIRPIKDDQPVVPGAKRFRCDSCGTLVEVTKAGGKLPPCPNCGDLGDWLPVDFR